MNYIHEFLAVIDSVEQDNTYKLAWAKAILECIEREQYERQDDDYVIAMYDLVQHIMKYYWNLIAFFDLSQGPSSQIEARIDEIRDDFYNNTQRTYPVWYDKVETYLKRIPMRLERQIAKFITIFNKGVAAKFRVHRTDKLTLYDLDTKLKQIRLNHSQFEAITTDMSILERRIDFQWAKLLEEYNKAPNIIKKVLGMKDDKIVRQNLHKYRNLLLRYYHLEGAKDFFTGELVDIQDISMEHLIPFNFIYNCDIWNLIIVSKETAKMRRGMIPSEAEVERLHQRNVELFEAIKDTKLQARFDLENALDNHLLKRYFIDLKG